ncbi:type II secretion system F family protein [Cohnella nanjingensis]|uniref:Type II secretion system F family protein n=1 Tax=Cohnella nanjingensis TaxID=1387779 RepID=A0A7X0RWA7_9BACL|nr:type II secretion system F family protein [Cohnella nanjingensis]MBB6674780.1 type II secretion system F family protein [Cohnella nanjingensis]
MDAEDYGHSLMTGAILAAYNGLLAIGYAWLCLRAWRHRLNQPKRRKKHLLFDPMEALLSLGPVWRWLVPKLQQPQSALAVLNGGVCTRDTLRRWAGEAAGYGAGALCIAALLGWLSGSPTLVGLGVVMGAVLPLLRWQELRKKLNFRRQAIVLELPELLNRLLLMVNAGENVMRALEKCQERKPGAAPHPLYVELGAALEAAKRGEPLAVALEEFGRRCAVPEAKLFATTLLMNARRGGDLFVTALRELSRTLWERRKAAARTLGEQASSRLAFPLALIFLLIMVLVGAPSFFLMANG